MIHQAFYAIALLIGISSVASATPTLSIGTYCFPPGPNNIIEIYATGITGEDQFNGMVLNLYFPSPGPVIKSLDAVTGTVFESNHNPQSDYDDELPGSTAVASITTFSGYITHDGLVATAVIDTTGLAPGSPWTISLYHPEYENSYLTGTSLATNFDTVMINGLIGFCPEPSSLVLGLMAASGVAAAVIRKRQPRKTA